MDIMLSVSHLLTAVIEVILYIRDKLNVATSGTVADFVVLLRILIESL